MAGGADLKARANAIADGLIGAGAGTLAGTAGVTGPFKLQVEYLHRTNQAVVVIVALTPLATYTGASLFNMSDTAGGSAVAQFGDPNAYQCEVFAPGNGKVDFLFVVDDSCSMATYQNALASTAMAVQAQLNNSTLDWRISLVTSSYSSGGGALNQNTVRGFTRDIDQFRSWLTQNSTCNGSMVCTNVTGATPACWGSGANGGCWVSTGGNGTERILESGARAMTTLTPVPAAGQPDVAGKVRNGAQLVVVLLGDADDQSAYNVTQLSNFFGTLNATIGAHTNRLGPVPVHGIICPDSSTCGEVQNAVRRNPAIITARGGVRGDITNAASITNAVGLIINSAIASAGYRMQKPPIGASVKVAMDAVQNGTACNKNDLPRSRADGFDFDGINRSLSFFGACRPASATSTAAVSYRYWIDSTPNPGGNPRAVQHRHHVLRPHGPRLLPGAPGVRPHHQHLCVPVELRRHASPGQGVRHQQARLRLRVHQRLRRHLQPVPGVRRGHLRLQLPAERLVPHRLPVPEHRRGVRLRLRHGGAQLRADLRRQTRAPAAACARLTAAAAPRARPATPRPAPAPAGSTDGRVSGSRGGAGHYESKSGRAAGCSAR